MLVGQVDRDVLPGAVLVLEHDPVHPLGPLDAHGAGILAIYKGVEEAILAGLVEGLDPDSQRGAVAARPNPAPIGRDHPGPDGLGTLAWQLFGNRQRVGRVLLHHGKPRISRRASGR